MTVYDVLVASRDYLSDPDHWAQGAASDLFNPNRICSIEAVYRFSDNGSIHCDSYTSVVLVLEAAADTLGYPGVSILNDQADHATVMAMFDLAIAAQPQAGLAEPSIPLVVPAPNEEPRTIPAYPSTPPEPIEEPAEEPAEAPEPATPEREPVPA